MTLVIPAFAIDAMANADLAVDSWILEGLIAFAVSMFDDLRGDPER